MQSLKQAQPAREAISLTDFKRAMYRGYEHPLHLEALDAALMQVSEYVASGGERGIGRLIVEMPPRAGKTLTTSRLFPAWHIGNHPDHRLMLVSYGASLSDKNSRAVRNLIRSPRYHDIFGIELARDSAAADSWDIEGHEGGCDAMGIGGAATGKGSHVMVIDDALKSRAEAESEVYRDRIWDAFTDDLYTRLEPGGAIIVMMTRWHQDDLIGRLLARQPGEWARLRFPALAEDNDALGRAEGEALWPERYDVEALARIKATLGTYSWAALYQQRPMPREGGLFRWQDIDTHRATEHPALKRIVVAVDPSGSARGDEVGIVAAGIGHDNHLYVLDDKSLHGTPDRWGRVAVTAYLDRMADRVLGESNFGGDMVEHVLRTVNRRISYKPIVASRGKALRAEPVAALYEQGRVHHVGYFDKLEDEMTTWQPGAASPNRMDALVFALTELGLTERDYGPMKVVKYA